MTVFSENIVKAIQDKNIYTKKLNKQDMGYAMYFVKAGLLSIGGSYLESNYFPNF